MERATEIEDLTRRLYDAMERGDGSVVAGLISNSEAALMIGTDPNEYWTDYETITRVWSKQLEELSGVKVEDADPHAYSSGDIAWMSDRPTFRTPDDVRAPFRITGVFRREDGAWKLVQGHASIGVENEEAIGTELTTS